MPSTTARAVTRPSLPLPRVNRGKVREIYALGDDLLLVASDRISAFDIVFDEGVPDKGRVLTLLSSFWLDRLRSAAPHHRITTDADAIVAGWRGLEGFRDRLAGRAMLCHRAAPLPVECVVRGYLDGSGWREYQATGTVTGIRLPAGLLRGDRLPEPIFTPATKAVSGHDENIGFDRLEEIVGAELAGVLRQRSLALYREGRDHAADRGLILADTKFEFGWIGAGSERRLALIDEVLTPDSSRFWEASSWSPGGAQPSFDKQPVRDFLEVEREADRWDGGPPLPPLSADAIRATTERYREAYRRLTGDPLPEVA